MPFSDVYFVDTNRPIRNGSACVLPGGKIPTSGIYTGRAIIISSETLDSAASGLVNRFDEYTYYSA